MPLDFINYVESGVNRLSSSSTDWLRLATVHGLTDIDLITLPPEQRAELFRSVDRFRAIADSPLRDAAEEAEARTALLTIWELLRPYRTPESRAVRQVLWAAWEAEQARSWIPTFDYQLDEDSTGDPAIRVWLILEHDTDREDAEKRKALNRLELLFRVKLQEEGIERWPYVRVRTRSEVTRPTARASA